MDETVVTHLVKMGDLNHHGTLFAGKLAQWFVEAGFIAAAKTLGSAQQAVCVQLHGLQFTRPGHSGDIIDIRSQVVYVGKTSLTVYGKVTNGTESNLMVRGFLTFVSVDEQGKPMPHHLPQVQPQDQEERNLYEQAQSLR